MNWKEKIRRVSRAFAVTALAFFIASAILFGLVQTDWGIRALAGWASSLHGDLTFRLDGVSGLFPFRFEVHRVTIQDRQGVWLEAGGIKVHWSARHLTKGQIYFKELALTSVNFERLPMLKKGKSGPFPSWILALRSDRLTINRATTGKELLGEPAVLKLDARLPVESPGHDFKASLRIERTDHAGTILLGSAVVGRDGTLRLDLSFEEKERGFIGKALGTQGPLSLSFLGEGSLEQCKGRLRVAVPPWGQLESDWVAEGIAVNPAIRSQGRLSLTPGAVPPSIQVWFDGDTLFDLQARLIRGEAFVVEHFELRARDLGLTLTGQWDFENSVRSTQFLLSCRELKPLKEVLGFDIAGTLDAEGSFSEQDETVRFSATGSVDHFQVQGSKTMPGKTVSWELEGEGSPRDVFFFKRVKITAENLSLDGAGEIKIPEPSAAIDAFFEIKDLRPFSSLESLAGWSTQGKAHLSWDAASGALSCGLQGKLQPSPRAFPAFLAKELHYSGTLTLENATLLNLSGFEMAAPWGTLQGDAKIDLPQESLKGTWHLLLPDLAPFSAELKGGPLEVRGTVQGPVNALTLSADATARGLSVSGFHFDTGHASLRSEIGSVSQGNVKVDAQAKELALRGHADFDLSNQHLNLKGISLEGAKSRLTGALILFFGTSLVEGELKAECNDLAALSPLIHEKVQGSAVLQARLFPSEEGQKASLFMDARDVEFLFGKALRSRIEAHGTLLEKVPRGRMTLEIQNGIVGDVTLPSSTLILEGDLGNTNFQIGAEGYYKDPFEFKASGTLTISSAEERVTLNHLEGRYGGTSLSLLQPATVARSSERINLGEWLVKLGSGQIQGSGYVQSTDLSLDLRFDGVPLQLIPVQQIQAFSGLARGNARLSGSPARPEATANLQIETLRFHDQGLPSTGLNIQAALRDNLLQATVLLQGLSNSPLRAEVRAPFPLSMSPLMLATPSHGEITGTLRGEIDLEQIGRLVDAHEQKLSGLVELNLDLEGSWDRPGAHGEIRLRKGSYENLRTGTILREIEVDIAARTPMLVVNRAIASDGEKGRLSAQGQFELSSEQGFRIKLDLALEKAKPFRYDWASAVVGGNLTLTGSLSEALLAGQIRVDTAEFRIPERLAPEIQGLQVIEINKPGVTQQAAVEAGTPRLWPLSLNLTVLSPGRVFLNGRGLDSEWQGEVRIKAEATQPSVAGALSVVRGSVNLFGKRFELKKGSLFLDGSSPPSPRIDVEAESKSREIVAYLRLSGPLQTLEIKLSSDPPLPPDEILSRLLFGRSASNITPLQALQLADSINTLARGGGLDLLGRTRQLLGLDQLTLKQTGKEQKDTSLSAGKYLSEEVYIEMEQGISPETGKASLKWEITPHVSVQTEVGVNAEAGVGINWRWDY